MSVVRINAITVPAERAEELLNRFAHRAGEVSKMKGFEAFELLKPTDGRDTFLVYTRWATQEDFDAWVNSPAFQHGHRGADASRSQSPHASGDEQGSHGHAHNTQGPVSTASELWSFDVAQQEIAAG